MIRSRYQVFRIWGWGGRYWSDYDGCWEVLDMFNRERLNICRTRAQARQWARQCNHDFRRCGKLATPEWAQRTGMVVRKSDGSLVVA